MKLKFENRHLPPTIFSILYFLSGFFVGILSIELKYITLDRNISLSEFATVLASIFIAIYIPFFLNNTINKKRIEKDILIEGYQNLLNEMKELKAIINEKYISQKIIKTDTATHILIKIRSQSKMLANLRRDLSLCISDKDIDDLVLKIISDHITFKKDLTITLRNRRNKITSEIYSKTENNYMSYTTNILRLKRLINDY